MFVARSERLFFGAGGLTAHLNISKVKHCSDKRETPFASPSREIQVSSGPYGVEPTLRSADVIKEKLFFYFVDMILTLAHNFLTKEVRKWYCHNSFSRRNDSDDALCDRTTYKFTDLNI